MTGINYSNLSDDEKVIYDTYWQIVRKLASDLHLIEPEIDMLILLKKSGKSFTANEYVKFTGRSKFYFSRYVETLREKGYVKCERDFIDRRAVHISLTDEPDSIFMFAYLQLDMNFDILFDKFDKNSHEALLVAIGEMAAGAERR